MIYKVVLKHANKACRIQVDVWFSPLFYSDIVVVLMQCVQVQSAAVSGGFQTSNRQQKMFILLTCIHSSGETALSKDRVNEEAIRLDAIIILRNFSRSIKNVHRYGPELPLLCGRET